MLQIKDYPESACDCESCVAMCERFPCRPLPEEVAALDPRRLMLNHFHDGVCYLQPAEAGYEMGEASRDRHMRCNFLTEDGKCELHGTCKPFEGRVAPCSEDDQPDGHIDTRTGMFHERLSELIYEAWNTDLGREVVAAWREGG